MCCTPSHPQRNPHKETTTMHIFFTAFSAWGHTRPFCILAARLAKERSDITLSLILSPTYLQKAEDEISSELRDDAPEGVRSRIRVFSSFAETSPDPFEMERHALKTLPGVYQALLSGDPITCAVTGTTFNGIRRPSVAIVDVIALEYFRILKSLSGDAVPIIGWATGHGPSIIQLFAPESFGGRGDVQAQSEVEAARLGITLEELGNKALRGSTGTVIKSPGVPEMYDYELFPQPLPFEFPMVQLMAGIQRVLEQCDGVLAVISHEWEQEAIDVFKTWFSEEKKEVYAIGPLLPSSLGVLEQSHRSAEDIKLFLDKMLALEGENSVILVSFGSMFWPNNTEYLEEVVDVLIEKRFPFILGHGSPFANITENFRKKVESSGIGHLTPWCPQQYILNHPATGWFLSHCGHNSVTEALGSGIPIIAWPFDGDQPIAAFHIASLGLAIELLEVRVGENAKKPLRRNGKGAKGTREAVGDELRNVIDECRGKRGEELRGNAQKMKAKLREAWDAEGPARKELDVFLEKYNNA